MPASARALPAGVPVAYVAVALLWSTTPLAINWSLEGGGFAFSLLARMLVGLIGAVALLWATRAGFPLRRGVWPAYLIGGTSLFGTMLCVYWGAQFIHSGLISVLFGLSPLMTSLIAATCLSERSLTPTKLLGMAIAFAGVAVVFGRADDLGTSAAPTGLVAVLAAVFINSAGLVGMKRVAGGTPPLAITAGIMLISLPLFALAWFLIDGLLPTSVPLRASLAIAYLGLFGSVLGFALYYYVMKHLEAGTVAMITVLTPLLALFLGHAFNGEALPPQVWLGALAISVGLYLNLRGGGFSHGHRSSRRATSCAASAIDSSHAIIIASVKKSIQPSPRERNWISSKASK